MREACAPDLGCSAVRRPLSEFLSWSVVGYQLFELYSHDARDGMRRLIARGQRTTDNHLLLANS
jgi:hypothetical protein